MGTIDGRNPVAIEITPAYEAIVTSLKVKMDEVTCLGSISRVNEGNGCRENLEVYVPNKISIGPLHHDEEALKAMEDHKLSYLSALLSRRPNIEASLDNCVHALKRLESKARLCYDTGNLNPSSDDFVKLMLTDAGFIIELFLRYSVKGLKSGNDIIFTTPGFLFELKCDMILLENQIPFFILQTLFQIVPIPKQCNQSLTDLAFRFFRNMIPGEYQANREKFGLEGNHLLDKIRHCFVPTIPRNKVRQNAWQTGFPCATELEEKGVTLKRARRDNLLDIKFVDGVLEIPPLQVYQYTESLLGNFIAYEHKCRSIKTHHVASYVTLMKRLISSVDDVKLLSRKGILTSYDEDDDRVNEKEFYNLFERLSKTANSKAFDFFYDELCAQVKAHKATNWCEWLKKEQQENAPVPSTLIYVVVFSLIALIFLGTLFSVLSFFRHH